MGTTLTKIVIFIKFTLILLLLSVKLPKAKQTIMVLKFINFTAKHCAR